MAQQACVEASAPSKLILFGEHAVVYGKAAVAASLGLRTKIKIAAPSKLHDQESVVVSFPDVFIKESWALKDLRLLFSLRPSNSSAIDSFSTFQSEYVDEGFLDHIKQFLSDHNQDAISSVSLKSASLLCFLYLYSLICNEPTPLRITVESEIPIGSGLGSSAALSVCLAAGLMAVCKKRTDSDIICKFAYVSEKILHGNPSGIDNSVSTFGGFVQLSDFKLSHITDAPPLRVMLVNTGVKRNTKAQVEKVSRQYQELPDIVKPIMDSIDGVTKSCLKIFELFKYQEKNEEVVYKELSDLIQYNQKLLEALQVSHPKITTVLERASTFGLQAKLTGAGGGGFVFVLIPPNTREENVTELAAQLESLDMECHLTTLGTEGVQINVVS